MLVSVFCYQLLDRTRVTVSVLEEDGDGNHWAVWTGTDMVRTPAWLEEYPPDWIQFAADRMMQMAYREQGEPEQLPISHASTAAPPPGPEPERP